MTLNMIKLKTIPFFFYDFTTGLRGVYLKALDLGAQLIIVKGHAWLHIIHFAIKEKGYLEKVYKNA